MESPSRVSIPNDAPASEKQILQPQDLRTLFGIDHIEHYGRKHKVHYIHAWRFAVLTGLRPGELYGLRNEDVVNGMIYVRRARNAEKETTRGKNKNARRCFLLPRQALAVIVDQEQMLKDKGIISPWIFPDETGAQTEQLHAFRLWKTYRKQHGIDSTPYEMRHTMVSIAGNDMPEKLLKTIEGHSAEMDTLGVYGHRVDGELEHARQIIDEAFGRILE